MSVAVKAEEKPAAEPNLQLEMASIVERHKSVRYVCTVVAILLAICVICATYVNVSRPSWEVVVMALIAPGGLFTFAVHLGIRHVRHSRQRIAQLEEMLNEERTKNLALTKMLSESSGQKALFSYTEVPPQQLPQQGVGIVSQREGQ